jgi:hypothetical protein
MPKTNEEKPQEVVVRPTSNSSYETLSMQSGENDTKPKENK